MQVITKNWEKINPQDIETYIRSGGYEILRKVIREMQPLEVIEEVKASGLRGRGGAGFATGDKWELAAKTNAKVRYFICNFDESEPGVYKDRIIAEKNPHLLIEGILLGAYAIGAKKAFIYINGHYQKQKEILELALDQARDRQLVGKGIFGSAVDVEIEIFQSAGAYICGEETALINTVEGKRGEPRLKPPYPPVSGLFGKPTIVNNAETLANVPFILKRGAKTFSAIGSIGSPGTKLFVLEGAVKNRGMVEAPLGTTIHELIFNSLYGGGLTSGKELWFAQIGGASGRIVMPAKLDQPLSYSNPEIPVGCGSILVVDKTADIKEMLFSWADFFHRESCGKCTPCREGTFRLWEIAKRLKAGKLSEVDRGNIEEILWLLSNTTFCALGSFAATAWKDAMKIAGKEIFSELGSQ